jgi:hypothetical protein
VYPGKPDTVIFDPSAFAYSTIGWKDIAFDPTSPWELKAFETMAASIGICEKFFDCIACPC